MSTTSTTDDQSKIINITNNSGTDISILTPTVEDPSKVPNGIVVYDQDLVILKDTDGGSVLSNDSNKNYLLEQYYEDSDTHQQEYSTVYNILGQTSDWYMPVANIGVMQLLHKFMPQTITKKNYDAMKQAANFYQTISAYPTSKLSTDFQAAMSSATTAAGNQADGSADSNKNIGNSITDNVNKFFKSTQSYQDVTLGDFVSMQSYYQDFPFAWAGYGSSTFYLYSSDGKSTSFLGTISLTKPETIDLTQPNGGYKCVFTPSTDPSDTSTLAVDTSKAKELLYTDSLFVYKDDPDNPGLAIKGTFQVKSTLTQNPNDTDIIPLLTGTVNGLICTGFNQPQKKDDPDNSDFWNLVFHPKGAAQIFQCIMMWGGALMMLHFFGSLLWGIGKKIFGKKEPTTKELFDKMQKELSDKLDAQSNRIAERISNGENPGPRNPKDALQQLVEKRGEMTDIANADKFEGSLDSMAKSLEDLAQYEEAMTMEQKGQLEEMGNELNKMQDTLDSATTRDLNKTMKDLDTQMKDFSGKMTEFSESMGEKISEATKANIAENTENVERVSEEIKTANEEQERVKEEFDPKDEPIEPEL
ncbi:hypothetical protein [Terasakiella sp. SH-1]|uniref:hypothetical protein n=1 Tax=Terasakiella sp. SH-1 TaxID=2560057 RepID=UPI001073BF23|nr:hypothetical protein [Terasakiella sp. SH-1]